MNSFSFLPILKSLMPNSLIEIHLQNLFYPHVGRTHDMDLAGTDGPLHQGLCKYLTQAVTHG